MDHDSVSTAYSGRCTGPPCGGLTSPQWLWFALDCFGFLRCLSISQGINIFDGESVNCSDAVGDWYSQVHAYK